MRRDDAIRAWVHLRYYFHFIILYLGRDPLMQLGVRGVVLLIRLCMFDVHALPLSLTNFVARTDITFVGLFEIVVVFIPLTGWC
jgi:hypothetical protein